MENKRYLLDTNALIALLSGNFQIVSVIAATAIVNNAVIVTRDNDFLTVDNLSTIIF